MSIESPEDLERDDRNAEAGLPAGDSGSACGGPIASHCTNPMKFEAIVNRLIEGRIVPFLGAGISFDCSIDSHPGQEIHKTGAMTETVKAKVTAHPGIPLALRDPSKLRSPPKKPETPLGLAEWCELFVDAHPDDAQGQKALVDLLKIPEFKNLRPTPAHRFIAYLAREGLINEILTTNYDCAMERAWLDTFGTTFDINECAANPTGPSHCACSLESYRASDARRTFVGVMKETDLRVFKLNGCARSANPDAILLTERSIQAWRERQWAADLVRDRLRCRSLLFCGFGSPEPQIRHTVGQVLEEFSLRKGHQGSVGKRTLLDEPNCPFVAVCDEPTFHQWQIAAGFRCGHGRTNDPNDLLVMSRDVPADKPVGGGASASDKKLTADRLWGALFRQVARSLIEREADPYRSRAATELRDPNVHSDLLLASLLKSPQWEHALKWLTDCSRPASARFSELLLAIGFGDLHDREDEGRYAPLRDAGPIVIKLALLWIAAGEPLLEVGTEGAPLTLQFDGGPDVFVSYGLDSGQANDDNEIRLATRVRIMLDPQAKRASEVRDRTTSAGAHSRNPCREYRIPLHSILENADEPVTNLDTFAEALRAALRAPSSLMDARAASIRHRNNARRIDPEGRNV